MWPHMNFELIQLNQYLIYNFKISKCFSNLSSQSAHWLVPQPQKQPQSQPAVKSRWRTTRTPTAQPMPPRTRKRCKCWRLCMTSATGCWVSFQKRPATQLMPLGRTTTIRIARRLRTGGMSTRLSSASAPPCLETNKSSSQWLHSIHPESMPSE